MPKSRNLGRLRYTRRLFSVFQGGSQRHSELLRESPGTHRFQRAVSAKDEFIRTRTEYASTKVWGRLIPINRSLAETARWKRCVPRARFHCFWAPRPA